MPEQLFDLSAEYEEMLNRGIRLSGEDREFFIRGRIAQLQKRLPEGCAVRRILDFGCGTGNSAARLAEVFPDAQVYGIDSSVNALEFATARFGSTRISFGPMESLASQDGFDLCYVNGVFHHIVPDERNRALLMIRDSLLPGGHFALFENNPWNPGARMVMRNIPFDRDAQTISIPAAKRIVRAAAFSISASWSMFYFPRQLAFLRFLEPALAGLPLGAQYCVLATTPALPHRSEMPVR